MTRRELITNVCRAFPVAAIASLLPSAARVVPKAPKPTDYIDMETPFDIRVRSKVFFNGEEIGTCRAANSLSGYVDCFLVTDHPHDSPQTLRELRREDGSMRPLLPLLGRHVGDQDHHGPYIKRFYGDVRIERSY